MSEDKAPLLDSIKNFIPINELSTNLQQRLLDRATILECKKSRYIFKQGDTDSYSYYLLDGEVEFYSDNQLNSVITSGSDRSRYALAQLQPRQFSAKAKTPLKILQVERSVLDQMLVLAQETTSELSAVSADEMTVDVIDGDEEESGDWMTQMLQSELFSRMPMANIHQLFALLEPVDFSAGDVVIQQGDVGEDYFIISEGQCIVSRKPSPKAKDVKLAELGSGDSFGEEALISNSKRNATITMKTNGVLMRLGKDTFVELIKNPTLHSVNYEDAKALVEQGAKWLDVRYPNEHEESSIDDSINVPLNALRVQTDKLEESTKYILYCDTGGRSSTGAFLLAERGFDVAFLDGGLVNNPEAVGVKTVVPKAPEPEEEEVDADVKVEMLNAELKTTEMQMEKASISQVDDDEAKKKEQEENLKQLEQARKKIEQQKKQAEAESKKRAKEEEARMKKLKSDADKKMKEEKKKLEAIYNKNTEEMSKLQKLKEDAEAKLRKEREALEKQAAEAKKQLEEAEKLKKEQEEAAKKQMEEAEKLKQEIEASKKQLEEQAALKQLEQDKREKELQAKAKAKIEAERKKLAEQYERNTKEFEELQKQKAAAAAARAAAKEEAAKIIEEYKSSHDKERDEEKAKLEAERKKLEEEAKQIRETMKQIQEAKLEAERIKKQALEEADSLREKQQESTSSREQREKLEAEIKAAEQKAIEAEQEIEDAIHKEKLTESAQQENESDLEKKKQEQEALLAKISDDLDHFENEHESEAPSVTQMQMQADMMKRIKDKAQQAKKQAAAKNASLLDDISNQLGKSD